MSPRFCYRVLQMADRILAAKQSPDTDALSPRDVNIQLPNRAAVDAAKVKAALASKAVQKDKEHPPPPPSTVYEPPSSDRKDGATYHVGKMLGKGGFAVCYEGQMPGVRKKFALKIVKSKMPTKMEQKVRHMCPGSMGDGSLLIVTCAVVPNRATDSLQDASSEHCPVPARFCFRQLYLPSPRAVP